MMPGDAIAAVVAGLSAVALTATARAARLVPELDLPGWAGLACYAASAFIILCCGLLLVGMIWGLLANWPKRAKTAMIWGWLMTVPACAGAAVFIAAGLGAGAGPANGYFLALGIAGILLFAIPALVFTVMALPGKP